MLPSGGSNPTEAKEDKHFTTNTGTVAFPTQPEAIRPDGEEVVVDNRTDAEKKAPAKKSEVKTETGVGSTLSTSGNTSTSGK